MVSAHFWMKNHSVKTGSRDGGVQVRYLLREGEFDPVGYMQRTNAHTKDYTDFVTQETQNLPAWAAQDPERFFAVAAHQEGANRYWAVAVQFSLPRELTHEQHVALTRDFVEATMPDLPVLWVKHDKRLDNGERHPHIHILLSARKMDEHERAPEQMFKKWNREQPARSGCEKDLFWSKSQAPAQLRHAFADITNYHLERSGAIERVDSRSLTKRGIDRLPKRWGNAVELDTATVRKEQARAEAAWEQRKAYKGIERAQDIPREAFLLHVRQWTRNYEPGVELPRLSPEIMRAYEAREVARLTAEAQQLERTIPDLEQYVARVQAERKIERWHEAVGRERPPAGARQAEGVLAAYSEAGMPPERGAEEIMERQVVPLGRARMSPTTRARGRGDIPMPVAGEPDGPRGRGVRTRIFQRENDYGRGI